MSATRRILSIQMPVDDVHPCSDDATWVCCLHCGEPLDLHQPEAEEPQRFLGTCGACGRWYLLDWVPGSRSGRMLLLPDPRELEAALDDLRGA